MVTVKYQPIEDCLFIAFRFYRYVLQPEIQFTSDGKLISGPMARFNKVPVKPLFTLNLDTPENWLVEVVRTPYDLDNIHLEDVSVSSVFVINIFQLVRLI